jgi:hypothetical protein
MFIYSHLDMAALTMSQHPAGYGTPATTPATSAASGGGQGAKHRNRRRHLHLVLLPYFAVLLTLLP